MTEHQRVTTQHDIVAKRPLLTPAGWLCIGLGLVGCMAVFNATFHLDTPYRFAAEQILWILPAALLLLLATHLPQNWIWKLVLPASIVTIPLLWIALPKGFHVDGAFPWFNLFGVRIQIAELAKPLFALFVAWLLHKTDTHSDDWQRGFLPLAGGVALWITPMIIKPAPGMAIVYLGSFLIAILCSDRPARHMLAFAALATIALALLMHAAPNQPYTTAITNPNQPITNTWQAEQFQRALASGGMFGKSLGHTLWAQFNLAPSRHDSVFAALGETLGLAGLLPLVLLLLAWVAHGSKQARIQLKINPIHAHAIVLLTALPATQAFIHLSVNLGLAPYLTTPLPLFSHGGSSLISSFIIVGLLENLRLPTPR